MEIDKSDLLFETLNTDVIDFKKQVPRAMVPCSFDYDLRKRNKQGRITKYMPVYNDKDLDKVLKALLNNKNVPKELHNEIKKAIEISKKLFELAGLDSDGLVPFIKIAEENMLSKSKTYARLDNPNDVLELLSKKVPWEKLTNVGKNKVGFATEKEYKDMVRKEKKNRNPFDNFLSNVHSRARVSLESVKKEEENVQENSKIFEHDKPKYEDQYTLNTARGPETGSNAKVIADKISDAGYTPELTVKKVKVKQADNEGVKKPEVNAKKTKTSKQSRARTKETKGGRVF